MEPFLSIIIPFYGTADPVLLQRCITSIQAQQMEEGSYEIIVSQDPTQTTGGARNSGMQEARGEYVFFVDADDLLLPHSLLPCIELLKDHAPDILKFGFQAFSRSLPSQSRHLPSCPLPFVSYPSGADFMLSNNFTGVVWAHLYRRSFLISSSALFYETSLFDDEEFVAKAYCHARKMLVTSHKVYAYYHSPTSLTKASSETDCRRRVLAFKAMLFRLIAFNTFLQDEDTSSRTAALNRRISFLTIDYIRQMRKNHCGIKEINRELFALLQEGQLPLPDRRYSWKYTLVRYLLNVYIRIINHSL